MKITVLNGSPKGNLSGTLQYVNFMQKKFPGHELRVHHISQRINKIEKDASAFQEIMQDIKTSDGVLWALPVYIFLVPSQYKRFIELLSERKVKNVFRNKYTAVITTSIHFFDHTANEYMHAICDDLSMKYAGFFSADMHDLLKEEERKKLLLFAESFFEAIVDKAPAAPYFKPLSNRNFDYVPGPPESKVNQGDNRILLLTDSGDSQTNLGKMIRRFKESFTADIRVIDLNDIDIKGGCLGCIECGFDYRCSYTGKDGFIDFYNNVVKESDILVYAGTITDRYLSSKWKQFFDRRFFMTHTPTKTGKQVAFIVSGPLSQIANLRQILTSMCELEMANLADIVTDEYGDSAKIDSLLQSLAERLVRYADRGYVKPSTFLGVGGRKVFRDDIWGRFRFPFLADHQYYEKHGFYDFPQYDTEKIEFNEQMIDAIKNPEVKEQIRKMIKTRMAERLREIIEAE